MSFFTFTKLWRTLLLLTAVGLSGCGGNKDASAQKKSEEAAVSAKSEQGAASGKFGKLTDSRDGQKYKTVKIGNQVWMAENLRFKIEDSWCYENSEDSCKKYGRLYDWDMARVACPKGWSLPSNGEWGELVTVVGSKTGGTKLKSKSGWINRDDGSSGNGTDDYGFSALPGGARYYKGDFATGCGFWWTSTSSMGFHISIQNYYSRDICYDEDAVGSAENSNGKVNGYSVRCLKAN
jgi:uncharacterized protein (TIGR02145 family)